MSTSNGGTSTLVTRVIRASRPIIYEAFLDSHAVATWLPPQGMRAEVHEFDARPGGTFNMSLIYLGEHPVPGKSADDRDTFQGRFEQLVPDECIVWAVDFESQASGMAGTMRVTWNLRDILPGTEVSVLTENIPPGIRPEDNELGCRSSLENLAKLVE